MVGNASFSREPETYSQLSVSRQFVFSFIKNYCSVYLHTNGEMNKLSAKGNRRSPYYYAMAAAVWFNCK